LYTQRLCAFCPTFVPVLYQFCTSFVLLLCYFCATFGRVWPRLINWVIPFLSSRGGTGPKDKNSALSFYHFCFSPPSFRACTPSPPADPRLGADRGLGGRAAAGRRDGLHAFRAALGPGTVPLAHGACASFRPPRVHFVFIQIIPCLYLYIRGSTRTGASRSAPRPTIDP